MSIVQDWYWKKYRKTGYVLKKHSGIIDSFGELSEIIKVGDHIISPFDKSRDCNDCTQPQRLKVEINQAVETGANHWHPDSLIGDLASILSLAAGRIIRLRDGFVIEKEGEEIVCGYNDRRSDRHHPNLYCPILDKEIEMKTNRLFNSLNNIRSDDDIKKYLIIMKAIKLYRDSLIVLPYDEDTAYMLLVASGEVVGSEFSSITPGFDDLSVKNELEEIFKKHKVSEDCILDLKNTLVKPKQLRLRARFVDVICSNISKDFFETPLKILTPKGRLDENHKIIVEKWEERNADRFMKVEQLEASLKNIYDCRSSFVHEGEEWPLRAKMGSHDLISPIDTDKEGNAKKNVDGSYKLAKPLPTYFGFERIISNVLTNIVYAFGER